MGTWTSSTKVLRELVPTGVQLSHTPSACCPHSTQMHPLPLSLPRWRPQVLGLTLQETENSNSPGDGGGGSDHRTQLLLCLASCRPDP